MPKSGMARILPAVQIIKGRSPLVYIMDMPTANETPQLQLAADESPMRQLGYKDRSSTLSRRLNSKFISFNKKFFISSPLNLNISMCDNFNLPPGLYYIILYYYVSQENINTKNKTGIKPSRYFMNFYLLPSCDRSAGEKTRLKNRDFRPAIRPVLPGFFRR